MRRPGIRYRFARSLVRRATIGSLVYCLISLAYWFVGNTQGFMDETQLLILLGFAISAVGLMVFSAGGIATVVIDAIAHEGMEPLELLLFSGSLCAGTVFLVFSSALRELASGL